MKHFTEIPALSVRQPFAALIACGAKPYETRTWQIKYRGPLLVCAGKEQHELFVCYNIKTGLVKLENKIATSHFYVDYDLIKIEGRALCVVDLVNCRPFENTIHDQENACVDWFTGGFVWELENRRLVEPKEIKGMPGLFKAKDITLL